MPIFFNVIENRQFAFRSTGRSTPAGHRGECNIINRSISHIHRLLAESIKKGAYTESFGISPEMVQILVAWSASGAN
jgi:hypothetical protein